MEHRMLGQPRFPEAIGVDDLAIEPGSSQFRANARACSRQTAPPKTALVRRSMRSGGNRSPTRCRVELVRSPNPAAPPSVANADRNSGSKSGWNTSTSSVAPISWRFWVADIERSALGVPRDSPIPATWLAGRPSDQCGQELAAGGG